MVYLYVLDKFLLYVLTHCFAGAGALIGRKMPRGPADRPTKEEVREAERALILYAQREEYTH